MNTAHGYRFAVYKHLIPGIGQHWIDRLEPEHLQRLYARMMENGKAAGTAHQAHQTVRTALNEAVRRGHIARNLRPSRKTPRLDEEEIEPLTVDEVRRLRAAAAQRRNSVRWAFALALGLRQGEALGLKWSDVDLEAGRHTFRRNRLRPAWAHGCRHTCGRQRAGPCPERKNTRPETAETKSRAGHRTIGLPRQLVELLYEHREGQERERAAARDLWHNGGACSPPHWPRAEPANGHPALE